MEFRGESLERDFRVQEGRKRFQSLGEELGESSGRSERDSKREENLTGKKTVNEELVGSTY